MRRNSEAKFSDRLVCWFLRAVTLAVLSSVALGLALAGSDNAARRSAFVLFFLGSFIAYLAQVLADVGGAFSRSQLINGIIFLYSQLWLPTVAVFILSRLWTGGFSEAGTAFIIFGIFGLISFSSRARRLQREQLMQAT